MGAHDNDSLDLCDFLIIAASLIVTPLSVCNTIIRPYGKQNICQKYMKSGNIEMIYQPVL